MKTARNSKAKSRSTSKSTLGKVMQAVADAGSSLGSMVKNNVTAAEKYVTGTSKARSAKPSRKRRAVAA